MDILNSIFANDFSNKFFYFHAEILIAIVAIQGFYLFKMLPRSKSENNHNLILKFTSGMLVIFLVTVGPIHEISEHYLFSGHMFQHVVLTIVAPPLILAGLPNNMLDILFKNRLLSRVILVFVHPLVAFFLFNLVYSLWHFPVLYNMALDIHLIHFLEHALFFSTALLMWIPLLSPFKQISILAPPLKMMYLFFLSVGQIIVFGPITFSEVVLYSGYLNSPVTVITPLQDQIIGGIFMKISGGFIFLALFISTFFNWAKMEGNRV